MERFGVSGRVGEQLGLGALWVGGTPWIGGQFGWGGGQFGFKGHLRFGGHCRWGHFSWGVGVFTVGVGEDWVGWGIGGLNGELCWG